MRPLCSWRLSSSRYSCSFEADSGSRSLVVEFGDCGFDNFLFVKVEALGLIDVNTGRRGTIRCGLQRSWCGLGFSFCALAAASTSLWICSPVAICFFVGLPFGIADFRFAMLE